MKFSLAEMTRRTKSPRRSSLTLRSIEPPKALATDLAGIYLSVVKAWEAAAPRVIAEYERSLTPLHTDSADDLADLMRRLDDEVSRLVLTLTPRLRSWAFRAERWKRGKWIGAVLSATAIDLTTILMASGIPVSVDEAISWNVALVKDVNDQARNRISNAVYTGLRERRPARDVAKDIREATGMARRRSVAVASDQLSKLSSALDRERAVQAGISQYVWRHSGKLHPRPEHKARDGEVFRYDDPPLLGGRPDHPGNAPYCGCRAQARLVLE